MQMVTITLTIKKWKNYLNGCGLARTSQNHFGPMFAQRCQGGRLRSFFGFSRSLSVCQNFSFFNLPILLIGFLLIPLAHSSVCDRNSGSINEENLLKHKTKFPGFEKEIRESMAISKQDRVNVMCELKAAVLSRYALVEIKKERMGIDAEKVLELCVKRELNIESGNRLEFIDRGHLCLASFMDTHFTFDSINEPPAIFKGINVQLVEGKAILTGVNLDLISYLEKIENVKLNDYLKIGNEILEIDGVPVLTAANNLKKYIAASNESSRLSWAVSRLFIRNFLYPQNSKQSVSRIKIKSATSSDTIEITLPWFFRDSDKKVLDANLHLKSIGIPSYNALQLYYDEEKKEWAEKPSPSFPQYSDRAPLYSSANEQVYLDQKNNIPVLRVSEILNSKDEAFCYFQLMSFMHFKVNDSEKKEQILMQVVSNFLNNCEKKQLPLVIDLRSNGGGSLSLAEFLSNILMKKATKQYAGVVRSVPVSNWNLRTFSRESNFESLGAGVEHRNRKKLMSELLQAKQESKTMTDVALDYEYNYSRKESFNQDIIALITPNCISACDLFSGVLKSNKRAVLIGTHSNGTGAGFWSMDKRGETFNDSLGYLELRIPNFLFGVSTDPSFVSDTYEKAKELLAEHKPVQADVIYQTSLIDVMENKKGWKKKISEVLQKFESGTGTVANPQ